MSNGDRDRQETAARRASLTETERSEASSSSSKQALAPRAKELLELYTPERVDRYARLTKTLARWTRSRAAVAGAAALIAGVEGDADSHAATCEVDALTLGRQFGWWARFRLGLESGEHLVVAARLRAARGDAGATMIPEVVEETRTLEAEGWKGGGGLCSLACELVLAAPERSERRAWRERARAIQRALRRHYSIWSGLPPAGAQRLIFELARATNADPAELARRVAQLHRRLDQQLGRQLGDSEGRFSAALVVAIATTNDEGASVLIERLGELTKRLVRHRKRIRPSWLRVGDSGDQTDAAPLLALLALSHDDLDTLVGLLGALRRHLDTVGVRQSAPLTYFVLLESIVSARPELAPLFEAARDLFVRRAADDEAAAAVVHTA